MSQTLDQPSQSAALPADKKHLTGVDLMRFVAAILIIYLHSVGNYPLHDTQGFTRFAVPFFAASAIYFAVFSACSAKRTPIAIYAKSRALRIYLPFLLWSVIYLLARIAAAQLHGVAKYKFDLELLYTGSAHHLWFLPFILVATLASFVVARLSSSIGILWLVGILVLGLGVLTTTMTPAFVPKLGYTAGLSYTTLASACWGFSLAVAVQSGRFARINPRVVTTIALVGFLVLMVFVHLNSKNLALTNLCGLFALGAALMIQLKPSNTIKTLGGFAYGIYLVHILYIEGIQDVINVMKIEPTSLIAILVFSVSAVLAIITCYVLSFFAFSQYLGVPTRKRPKTA